MRFRIIRIEFERPFMSFFPALLIPIVEKMINPSAVYASASVSSSSIALIANALPFGIASFELTSLVSEKLR